MLILFFDIKDIKNKIIKNNKDKIIRKELHKQNYEEFNKVKKDLITFGELI